MATMVNGARIEWHGYEYGIERDADIIEVDYNFDRISRHLHKDKGERIVFRALYADVEWSEVTA